MEFSQKIVPWTSFFRCVAYRFNSGTFVDHVINRWWDTNLRIRRANKLTNEGRKNEVKPKKSRLSRPKVKVRRSLFPIFVVWCITTNLFWKDRHGQQRILYDGIEAFAWCVENSRNRKNSARISHDDNTSSPRSEKSWLDLRPKTR